jgi:hypothetical protein
MIFIASKLTLIGCPVGKLYKKNCEKLLDIHAQKGVARGEGAKTFEPYCIYI